MAACERIARPRSEKGARHESRRTTYTGRDASAFLPPGRDGAGHRRSGEHLLPGNLLASEASQGVATAGVGGLPGLPHFAPKAKRAIYLFMAGAPSQMDMFDYKPAMGEVVRQGPAREHSHGAAADDDDQRPVAVPHRAVEISSFDQYGSSGAWVSELMPYHGRMVDDITFVRSMYTEAINHDPAITYICTGAPVAGRASLGSWLSYGLGSLNENLPSFVVLTASWTGRQEAQALFNRLWGSGFLPSKSPGRGAAEQGRPGAVPFESGRHRRGAPAAHARFAGSDQPADARGGGRPRNAGSHHAVRNGVPHAELGAGVDRSGRASRSTFSTCTAPT